jgi:hypothetical protein
MQLSSRTTILTISSVFATNNSLAVAERTYPIGRNKQSPYEIEVVTLV